MKNLKKLQVAAAVAILAATGVAQAAGINQSTTVMADEVIIPLNNSIRVRAPAITYTYDTNGGPTAGANGSQTFEITLRLVGATGLPPPDDAKWAYSDDTDAALDGIGFTGLNRSNIINAALTIRARAGGFAGGQNIDVRAVTAPGNADYEIQLVEIKKGATIINDPKFSLTDVQAVTYVFNFVNRTSSGVVASDLALTFNATDPANPTTNQGQWLVINGLGRYVDVTSSNATTAACTNDTERFLAVEATAGQGGRLGNYLYNPPQVGFITHNPNYLVFRRALGIAVVKGADRTIAATNSFPTNLGANPTNGIGGTGGGRFTFKPTAPATFLTQFGGSNIVGSATNVGGNPTVTPILAGLLPGAASSGDERAVRLGSVAFTNRIENAADRNGDNVDSYRFAFPVIGQGEAFNRIGDFSTLGQPNVQGGVDVNNPGTALLIRFKSKANFGWRNGTGVLRLSGLDSCNSVTQGNGVLTEVPPGSGNYEWRFDHATLSAAAFEHLVDRNALGALIQTDTLRNKVVNLCYTVNGTTAIPAASFTEVEALLLRDDSSEQINASCKSTLANIYGGVKVDVRNWVVSVPGDDTWSGVTRIINNSEIDTATVEGQFIHPDSGAYGAWGMIAAGANAAEATALNALVPALKPRAVAYLFNSAIAGKLVNPSSASGADNSSVVAAASKGPGRLRVSADVSTIRVQSYIFNSKNNAFTEASAAQGADFVNIDSSNRDHIDQDAQRDIIK